MNLPASNTTFRISSKNKDMLLSDLPTDDSGAVIVDQKTLQLLRSGAQLVDQYGAPIKG